MESKNSGTAILERLSVFRAGQMGLLVLGEGYIYGLIKRVYHFS